MAQAELLRQTFAYHAELGELRACALIYEPSPQVPCSKRSASLLMIEIEHFTGYNVTINVPYCISRGVLDFSKPVVGEGVHRVFARRVNLAAANWRVVHYA